MNKGLHKAVLINAQPRGCKPLADDKPAHWKLELTTSHRIRADRRHGEVTQVAIRGTELSLPPGPPAHYSRTTPHRLRFFCTRVSTLPGLLPPHSPPSSSIPVALDFLTMLELSESSVWLRRYLASFFTKLLWYNSPLFIVKWPSFPVRRCVGVTGASQGLHRASLEHSLSLSHCSVPQGFSVNAVSWQIKSKGWQVAK